MVSRVERTPFAAWWWTVDRLMLVALLSLMLVGIILSLAASPPVASRLGLEPFYFVNRHVMYLLPVLVVMLTTSFLPRRYIRRLALVVFVVSLALIATTLVYGAEVKGARRWIVILGVNLQPSEFLKPAFVILIAWLFGETARRPEMPANTIALALLGLALVGLVLQPDFGQTMLIALVWGALFFLAGMRLIWVFGLGGAAIGGIAVAYFTIPHVTRRIQRFLDPGLRRHLQHRSGARILLARRLVRARSRRGNGQAHPAGKPYRLRICGRGRGVRHRALPPSGRLVRIHRDAGAATRHARRGSVRAFCGGRARNSVRTAIGDQHGGELAFDAGQGHDAAVHLLRRLLDDFAGLRHGHVAGPDPRTSARTTAGEPGRAASACEPGLMQQNGAPLVLLAAGGTGGHLFPAEALAEALAARGVAVDLATDERAERYGKKFPARNIHVITSETVRGRDPIALARTGAKLAIGALQAWRLLGRIKPAAVVGFGGYPTVPPVMAATLRRIPTIIHEQNAVMGRANRLLASRVGAIALSFAGVLDREPHLAAKATRTGNPVRPLVLAAAATPYAAPDSTGPLRLVAFGGSQGARIMADIVPDRDRTARAASADAARDRAAGARGGCRAGSRHLCAGQGCGRGRAVLRRSSGAYRGQLIS